MPNNVVQVQDLLQVELKHDVDNFGIQPMILPLVGWLNDRKEVHIATDAMLLGTPVVASNLGGIPENIEDGVNGFLADPYNPADFAGKLVPLLRDNVLSDKIDKKVQERILERNNNNRIWRNTLAVYARLGAKESQHAI